MPDALSLDNDVLSFTPGNPMLTAESSAPPPAAPPAPTARDYGPEIAQNRAAADAEIAKVKEAQAAQIGAMQGQAAAQQPFIDKALAQTQQPLPPRPKQEKPPAVPQRQSQHEDEQWLFASALLGSLAGALTRRHQTNALAAFSGAMDGYNEGSKQKFDQNMRTWEAENKRALETNKQAMDEYRDILEDRKLSAEQMFTAIKVAGLKNQDQAAIEVAKQQNGELLAKYYDKRADAALKAQESSDKLLAQEAKAKERSEAEKIARWDEAAKAYVASPEGQQRIIETMALRRPPPPQTAPRNNALGYREGVFADELSRLGYDFKAFKPAQANEMIEQTTESKARLTERLAEERRIGTSAANIGLVMRSADPIIDMAAEAAQHVPATAFPRLNALMQAGAKEIGDPAIGNLIRTTTEVRNLMARAMNPQSAQITNMARGQAMDLIDEIRSPEDYMAALKQFKQFVKREYDVINEAKEHKPFVPTPLREGERKLEPTPRQFLPKGAGLTDQGRETTRDIGEGTRTLQRPEERLKHTPLAPRSETPPGFPPLPPGWTFESLTPEDRS